jgi:hypothetical protein
MSWLIEPVVASYLYLQPIRFGAAVKEKVEHEKSEKTENGGRRFQLRFLCGLLFESPPPVRSQLRALHRVGQRYLAALKSLTLVRKLAVWGGNWMWGRGAWAALMSVWRTCWQQGRSTLERGAS